MPRLRSHLADLLKLTLLSGALWVGAGVLSVETSSVSSGGSTLSVASAQASVTVEVRVASGAAGDAQVTLTPTGGGASHSCRTRGGRCQIPGVPAGRYVVSAAPSNGGQSPIPRPVMIGGRATTVRVTLR
ncbi:MAG: carboxypeptidase-like regulatory domain-containing protein [Sandaracinaceae bacterium]